MTALPLSTPPEAAPREPAPTLPLWKRALFSAILLLIVAAMAELGARLVLRYVQGYDGTHLYQYDFDPYRNITPARNFVDVRGIRHNSQGFRRSTEVSRAKPANTYRIFLMGGSTAYGMGGLWPHIQNEWPVLRNDQTIDAYLEKRLASTVPGMKVEVINAAVTSTWTHHHLIALNETILGYQPDMVLFLDGFNDYFFADDAHDQFADYSYNSAAETIMGTPTVGSLVYSVGWWLFRKSAFAHLTMRVGRTVKALVSPKPVQQPIQVENAVAGFTRVFPRSALKMHRRSALILRDEGVTPVFMLQPMLILERDRRTMPPEERKLFDFNVSSYRPGYEAYIRRAVPIAHDLESRMAQELGAEYLDLTGIYKDARGQVYTDYAHLTPHGNELLADYVAAHILPHIQSDVARRRAASTDSAAARPLAAAATAR